MEQKILSAIILRKTTTLRKISIFFASFLLFPAYGYSESNPSTPNCAAKVGKSDKKSALATASIFANATNRKGSLRFESAELLSSAVATLESKNNACTAPCAQSLPEGEIVLTTVPNKFLTDYDDREFCEQMLVKTANQSFKFGPKLFATLAELNSWVGDFSQGKGTDGETLYKLCPRSCSPDYKYSIRKDNSGRFLVSAESTCRHARDKDDNQYRLELFTLWKCSPATS